MIKETGGKCMEERKGKWKRRLMKAVGILYGIVVLYMLLVGGMIATLVGMVYVTPTFLVMLFFAWIIGEGIDTWR